MKQQNKIQKLIQMFDNPEAVSDIKDQIIKLQETLACYRCALLEVETKFRVLDERFSIRNERNPIESIKTRIKSPESMLEKIRRKGYPQTFDSIKHLNDIAGVRVICSFVQDIYMLANCLISQDDVTLIEMRDYIKHPKSNGYRSLHLIIEIPIFLHDEKRNMRVEVQLRTIAMETWANLEHKLRYKKDLSDETQEAISAKLLECALICERLDNQMQSVRNTIEKETEIPQ